MNIRGVLWRGLKRPSLIRGCCRSGRYVERAPAGAQAMDAQAETDCDEHRNRRWLLMAVCRTLKWAAVLVGLLVAFGIPAAASVDAEAKGSRPRLRVCADCHTIMLAKAYGSTMQKGVRNESWYQRIRIGDDGHAGPRWGAAG